MEQESNIELPFPLGGISIATGFDKQPGGTTPRGVNVRAFDPLAKRARGGSRPGLSKYIASQVSGKHLVQHLDTITTVDPLALWDDWDFGDESRDGTGHLYRHGGSGRQRSRRSQKKTPRIVWSNPGNIDTSTPITVDQCGATLEDPTFALGSGNLLPIQGTIYFYGAGSSVRAVYDKSTNTYVVTQSGPQFGHHHWNGSLFDPFVGNDLTLNRGQHQPLYALFVPEELQSQWNIGRKRVFINVSEGSAIPSQTYPVSIATFGVNPPTDCFVVVTVFLGGSSEFLDGWTIDYHLAGWPAGQGPSPFSTYDGTISYDSATGYNLSSLTFTSFSPSVPE